MVDDIKNNEHDECEILFEKLLGQETEISEKYMKKGPASRIVNKVTPIKIKMTHAKTGTVFYKTYYVKNIKRDKYKKTQLEDVANGVEKPRYLSYTDQMDDMFNTVDKMPSLFKSKVGGWTSKVTQLTGSYNSALDRFGHTDKKQRTIRKQPKAIVDRTGNVTKIHDELIMDDVKTGSDGKKLGSRIATDATYTDRADGGVDFHYATKIHDGKLAKLAEKFKSGGVGEKPKDATSGRVIGGRFTADGKTMVISNAGKYAGHELGYLVARHSRKIRNIVMEVNQKNDSIVKTKGFGGGLGHGGGTEHLLADASKLGFSAKEDTFENWTSMKDSVMQHIKTNYGAKEAALYEGLLKNSSSLTSYLFHLGENKKIGRGISDDLISSYIKKIGAKQLVWSGSSTKRTTSSHMVNSYNLQKSPENDYHKGYITDYNIDSPREAY